MTQRKVTDTKPLNSLTLKLKNLNDQVMVITGATSGIGFVTARMVAEKRGQACSCRNRRRCTENSER